MNADLEAPAKTISSSAPVTLATYVPVHLFGKDHWSTLAYIETCCVDAPSQNNGIGELDKRRMRGNEKTHPLLAVNQASGSWQRSYGTKLAGYFDLPATGAQRVDEALLQGRLLPEHDDWDCLDDLAAAGLVETLSLANGLVRMTDLGNQVAGVLRTHKANGGQFATFVAPANCLAVQSDLGEDHALESAGEPREVLRG